MRVFIAGATGALGRATVPRLLAAGHQVTAVVRRTEAIEGLRSQGADALLADLFDEQAVRQAMDGCDAVVHMATSIPPMTKALLSNAWAANDRLRREGTQVLAAAAIAVGANVLVKESVCFFYPDHGERWIDEDLAVVRQPFSGATLDAEDTTMAFTGEGRRGVVLRFGLFYSADSRSTEESLRTARLGTGPMVGPADAYQPSIHVDDAATAVVAALDAPAGIYNVADEPITKGAWNEAFARAFDLRRTPRPTPRPMLRFGGSKIGVLAASRRISSERFRTATGWAPVHRDATAGLTQVAAEFKAAKQ